MSQPKVYLAGPITAVSYENATNWREEVRFQLAALGIEGVSPLRSKEYLLDVTNIADCYDDKVLSTQKAIVTRDRNDVMNCDGLIVNLLGAERASLGTAIEYGWADAWRKPIVTVMDLHNGNIHDHAMIRELSGAIVPTIEEAIWVMSRWVL